MRWDCAETWRLGALQGAAWRFVGKGLFETPWHGEFGVEDHGPARSQVLGNDRMKSGCMEGTSLFNCFLMKIDGDDVSKPQGTCPCDMLQRIMGSINQKIPDEEHADASITNIGNLESKSPSLDMAITEYSTETNNMFVSSDMPLPSLPLEFSNLLNQPRSSNGTLGSVIK